MNDKYSHLDIPSLAGHVVETKPKRQRVKAITVNKRKPITTSPERGKALEATGYAGRGYRLYPLESYLPILDMIAQGSTASAALRTSANVDNIPANYFYMAVNDISENGCKQLTDLYTACTQARVDASVDKINELLADSSKDIIYYTDKDGNDRPMVNSNATKRHEMIANQIRWQAGKESRKRFGDKQEVEVKVDITIRSALQQAMARAGMTYDNEDE